jgi:hypothetical protein
MAKLQKTEVQATSQLYNIEQGAVLRPEEQSMRQHPTEVCTVGKLSFAG